MIIGIVGYIGSGKSTIADILVEEHGYEKMAFADALKDAVSAIFGWPRELLEGETLESREFRETVDVWWSTRLGYAVFPRKILQRMGTEACRNNIGDEIWIAALEKRLKGKQNVVITDVRFPNEMDFVRNKAGILIRAKRGVEPTAEEKSKMHISEKAWNDCLPDYTILNDGTIDELKEKVKIVLTVEKNKGTIIHH